MGQESHRSTRRDNDSQFAGASRRAGNRDLRCPGDKRSDDLGSRPGVYPTLRVRWHTAQFQSDQTEILLRRLLQRGTAARDVRELSHKFDRSGPVVAATAATTGAFPR